jgi:hypothetical protein
VIWGGHGKDRKKFLHEQRQLKGAKLSQICLTDEESAADIISDVQDTTQEQERVLL